MSRDEAKAILPKLTEAAKGLYVFPRLTASVVLQPPRRVGTSRDVSDADLSEVVFDYAVFTSECELVCVVLMINHGKKPTHTDAIREELLRAAEMPVIKLRASQMPDAAVLRGHLQLALDQRRNLTRNTKGSKAAASDRIAVA